MDGFTFRTMGRWEEGRGIEFCVMGWDGGTAVLLVGRWVGLGE